MSRSSIHIACLPACLILFAGILSAQQQPGSEREVMTLKEAIRLALMRAPEIALAETQVAKSGEVVREVRASARPQVVAGTGLAYNNGFPLSIEGSAPSAFQIGVTQSIFSKRNNNLIREAEEGIKAAKTGAESSRNEIAARTALVYCELHQARRLEALWDRRSQAARNDERAVEALLEAGKVRPLELTMAKAATADADLQLLIAREQAGLALTELRELTGRPHGSTILTAEPQIDVQMLALPVDALYQKAVAGHPEILQAESNLRAKEFHLEAEKGGRYPRFDLVSQYALFTRFNNYQDYFNRFTRNNYVIGMSIQVPLFDGFQSSAKMAQGRQEVADAQLRLERAKSGLKLGLEHDASAVRVAKAAADLQRRELDSAREGLRVSQALLEAGRLSPKDLIVSQNLVGQKEIALAEAEKTLFQRQVELLRILGSVESAF